MAHSDRPQLASITLHTPMGTRLLQVEVLTSLQDLATGFRERPAPTSDLTGLWFVFPQQDVHALTMAGVPFNLDAAWFDPRGYCVGIARMAADRTGAQIYAPSSPNLFAIELQSGWIDRNGCPVRASSPA